MRVALLAAWLPLAPLLLTPSCVQGSETWGEALRDPSHVIERWGQGSLEFGRDGRFDWVRCTTRGKGSPALLVNETPYAPPLDLSRKFVKVWIRVDDVRKLGALEFRLSSDGHQSDILHFSVPLFVDPEFGLVQSGSWIPITFSLGTARQTGRPDPRRIDSAGWYVEDAGRGPVRFSWGGLAVIDTPEPGLVSFTFDDGYDEHARVAAPLMARHGLRGTAYVMPDQIGTQGYMTLAELASLRDRFGWDVAAHHAVPFTDFPRDELERTILGVRRFLTVNGFSPGADHLALPLGKHDTERVLPLVRKHFRTTRIAGAGPETLPPADPHRLRVLNVLASTPPDTVEDWARRAQRYGEWAILMFHFLVENPQKETEYSIENFRQVVDRVHAVGVPVRTVSDVWSQWGEAHTPALPASSEPPRPPISSR